MFEAYVKS
jgi:hypothetical protein